MDRTEQLHQLIDGTEELLAQLADTSDPAIQQLRERVDIAIGDARLALTRRRATAAVRVRDVARTVDDYIRDYPWVAVATGVLAAGTAAFIAGAVIAKRRSADAW